MEVITLSDEELVSQIQKGDRQSLDILVESYLPKVYTRVRGLVATEDVDDVTQEIFLALLRSIGSFQGKSTFATWFHRLINNKAVDHYRKKYRQRSKVDYIDDYEEDVLEWELCWDTNSDVEIDMERLLESLPEHYQEILLMRLQEDLSLYEIASTLEMGYEAARSRYRRAFKLAAKTWRSNCRRSL